MGISISELMILLAIAVVIFGTKRLRNVGTDLGSAIKSFRHALSDSEKEKASIAGRTENNEGDAASGENEHK
ncbi:MAG: twin-arginine translocase TatA/TatE family subunit [Gammaproteobacteria bacterium]